MTDLSAGANVFQQTMYNECACKDMTAICNTDCADNICAAKSVTNACSNCIFNKAILGMDKCYDSLVSTCEANEDCVAYLACMATCQPM